MTVAQTPKLPAFITRLVQSIGQALPSTVIDAQRVGRTNRYRLVVVSPRFNRMDQLKRQDLVWNIAESSLSPEELLRTSMIVSLAPEEVE
jgi:acid stress-induced BolA-like protein IbaG/YrbA